MGRRNKTDPDRFTYRFVKNGRAAEIHSDRKEYLLDRAVQHLESGVVLPVHIRQGKTVVWELDDITDAWQEKCL